MLKMVLKAIRHFRHWKKGLDIRRKLMGRWDSPGMGLPVENGTSSWISQDEETELGQAKELEAPLEDILFSSGGPTPDPATQFPFMGLPPEVRLMIYDYCLIVKGRITPYPSEADQARKTTSSSDKKAKKPAVALLQVNRQIREEAQPSLYGKNVWRLSWQSEPLLPHELWIDNHHLFRHVSVHFDHRDVTKYSRSEILSRQADAIGRPDGYATSPQYLQRVAHEYADMFLDVCYFKLRLLNLILPFLRSVAVRFGGVMHPATGKRKKMIASIGAISSPLWTIGSGTPWIRTTHDHAAQKRVNDPTRAPWHGRQRIVVGGLTIDEEGILFR
ncbi:MAG: hypothetical protein Q9184_006088 [Pyrenodesmia sp. 2 TL-2023]